MDNNVFKDMNENLKKIRDLIIKGEEMKCKNLESKDLKEENEEMIKYKRWATDKYKLNYYDIKYYLDKICKEENAKKNYNVVLPNDMKSFEDVIKFKCYNNDILDIMIKNDGIEIEKITKQLKFINDYQNYLTELWDIKDCLREQKNLTDNMLTIFEDVNFLNGLKK